MSEREWKRADAMARLGAGKLTMREVAMALGLSVRQVRRLRRRVEGAGPAGLQHGNRGRVPSNKLAAADRARLVALRRTTYHHGAVPISKAGGGPKIGVHFNTRGEGGT